VQKSYIIRGFKPTSVSSKKEKDRKGFVMKKLSAAIIMAALCMAGPALAHTDLVKSIPAADSTGPAPKALILTFSGKVVPAFTRFDLAMGNGMKIALTTVIAADGKVITCTPRQSLAVGSYKLTWHAASAADGHRTDGSFSFGIK